MKRLKALVVAVVVSASCFLVLPEAASAHYGANPTCFKRAHEQPTNQPPNAGSEPFGLVIQLYLEDCRGEIVLP